MTKIGGLIPALASLQKIMDELKTCFPTVYADLGTKGMLCCRLQRKSATRISNHAWGTAIDLTLCGKTDTWGNGKVQYGLTLIAPVFNRHGWVWGAAFRKEDGMHFEVSMEKLLQWKSEGLLATADLTPPDPGRGAVEEKTGKLPAFPEILDI